MKSLGWCKPPARLKVVIFPCALGHIFGMHEKRFFLPKIRAKRMHLQRLFIPPFFWKTQGAFLKKRRTLSVVKKDTLFRFYIFPFSLFLWKNSHLHNSVVVKSPYFPIFLKQNSLFWIESTELCRFSKKVFHNSGKVRFVFHTFPQGFWGLAELCIFGLRRVLQRKIRLYKSTGRCSPKERFFK